MNNTSPYFQLAACILYVVLSCFSASIHANYKDDIGFTQLLLEQGAGIPDGSGIPVTHVEAATAFVDSNNTPVYLPDPFNSEFSGKTITDKSGLATGSYSSHATSVGRTFYGKTFSITPGIISIDAYWAANWLQSGFLYYGASTKPLITSSRIGNHSWIGDNDDAVDSDLLRRTDWVVATDEFVQCVGIKNNASANKPILSSAYNVIAVGKSDGINGFGTAQLDSEYVSGRTRPELVAPIGTSSGATPVVSASAALLMEYGRNNPGLSTDPVKTSTLNRNGDTIYNTGRSEVIKAVLMAGADRSTTNTNAADITNYRVDPENQTVNGLDSRFGAGQVNIYNSFRIMSAGEQNSDEDIGSGSISTDGFDYDPSFGGSGGSNSTASYYFSTGANQVMLSTTLAWNIRIKGGSGEEFSGNAELYDLDLSLYNVTGVQVLLDASSSLIDNTETLWVLLAPGKDYMLQVTPKAGRDAFKWDYAVAWKMIELIIDTDGDGIQDSNDADDDNDGIPDAWEISNNLDPLDDSDASKDADTDGLTNLEEYESGSNPNNPDTDNDGLSDGEEVSTYATDPGDADTDNDGLNDSYEIEKGFNPLDSTDCPDWICAGSLHSWRLGLGK